MLYDSVISCKLDTRDSQEILGLSQMGKKVGISILEISVCYRWMLCHFFPVAEGEHTILIVAEGGR
jgi:hypothetical protein